jgi:hypothetical protein
LVAFFLKTGLKRAEFPTELGAQNVKATEIVKELIVKILGREEPFKLSVRRGANVLRKARDSTLLLLPPIEVFNLKLERQLLNFRVLCSYYFRYE